MMAFKTLIQGKTEPDDEKLQMRQVLDFYCTVAGFAFSHLQFSDIIGDIYLSSGEIT